MGSEEIGILRDLGKRAVWLLRGLRAGTNHDTHDEGIESEDGDTESCAKGLGNDREEYSHEENDQERFNSEAQAPTSSPEGEPDEAEASSTTIPGESPHYDSDIDSALAAARARILSSLTQDILALEPSSLVEKSSPILNDRHSLSQDADTAGSTQIQAQQDEMLRLHATLDMIITVVGEFLRSKRFIGRQTCVGRSRSRR